MSKTVIALYDHYARARDAANDLSNNGFDTGKMSIVANNIRGDFATADNTNAIQGMGRFRQINIRGIGSAMASGPLADRIENRAGRANEPYTGAEGTETGYRTVGETGNPADTEYGVRGTGVTGTGVTGTGVTPTGGEYGATGMGATPTGAEYGAPGTEYHTTGTGATGTTRNQGMQGTFVDALINIGVPRDDANFYAEGVRRGGTLLSLATSDDRGEKAADIMQKHDPVNIHGRADYWKTNENWHNFSAEAPALTEEELDQQRTVVPKVDEQLQVNKRQVGTGGIRVRTYVTEEPVEKTVNLRKEKVDVERRKVDRPATQEDMDAFKERTIRIPVVTEEADVDKQARVTEEVVIHKDVDTEQQKVKDTVRQTHVDTEKLGTQGKQVKGRDFDAYDDRFRKHFDQRYRGSNASYDQYRPAYQYGYNLGTTARYQNSDWNQVEPEAERRWEETNPNVSWDQVDEAVKTGFQAPKNQF